MEEWLYTVKMKLASVSYSIVAIGKKVYSMRKCYAYITYCGPAQLSQRANMPLALTLPRNTQYHYKGHGLEELFHVQ